ncbi:MAG TPA: FAD-dependent oxidoreductase, partial [Phenylobacterium sp.]|nr:FAD-dependent oxidoreductase [Phenylobacterium sp.]
MRNTGQPPGSWYAATATHAPGLVPLEGRATCEVCVVGAGFTGLGAALELAARGVSVVVLEAATVGSGGSGRNGGQVHTGQRRDQAWLEKAVGEADALALWRLAEDARAGLMALVQEIPCDWRPGLIHARHKPGGEAADVADIAHLRDRYG